MNKIGPARWTGAAEPQNGVRRPLAATGAHPALVDAMATITPPLDRAIHAVTGGRMTMFSALLPTLMLQPTGRKSGRQRRSPLLYASEPTGALLVVASNFGRPHHPAWSTNLIAQPHATVTRDGRTIPVTGHLLTGEDRDHAWAATPRSLARLRQLSLTLSTDI
jgi:deazaflavin-dependent oxidoreductase (nitroreductase family)